MIQASPQMADRLRRIKLRPVVTNPANAIIIDKLQKRIQADGSINWTSPSGPVGPDWYDAYIGTSPIPNDHPPSLKNPKLTKIPTAQDGWKKGDSKQARDQAMDDLVELHKRMRRQIGKPEISFPGSMPTDPHSMANVPVGSGLSSSAGKVKRKRYNQIGGCVNQ